MLDDLQDFIKGYYTNHLPHPLIIAQKFMLRFPKYGKDIGLSAISDVVDYVLKSSYQNKL
jgi:hypothetical protein